jgi:hypothetical protein
VGCHVLSPMELRFHGMSSQARLRRFAAIATKLLPYCGPPKRQLSKPEGAGSTYWIHSIYNWE